MQTVNRESNRLTAFEAGFAGRLAAEASFLRVAP
jgi:hypothetical protein